MKTSEIKKITKYGPTIEKWLKKNGADKGPVVPFWNRMVGELSINNVTLKRALDKLEEHKVVAFLHDAKGRRAGVMFGDNYK